MKYSIIVPIYNSEKTLSRCLDSILEQNYPDAELLLINDGSKDRSEEICLEYAGRYPNVVCRTTENRGVSAARNLGLELARGTYILFADSDDYVDAGYFQKIDRTLRAGPSDLIFFSYRIVGERSRVIRMPDAEAAESAEVARLLSGFLRRQQLNALWSKVFLRSVIEENHLRFDTSLDIDEDVNFNLSYALRINSLRTSREILYNNSMDNSESLTRKPRDYLSGQLQHSGLSRLHELSAQSLSETSCSRLRKALSWLYFRGAYSSAAELLKFPLNRKQRLERLRDICTSFSAYPDASNTPVISIPVRRKWVALIDAAAQITVHAHKR